MVRPEVASDAWLHLAHAILGDVEHVAGGSDREDELDDLGKLVGGDVMARSELAWDQGHQSAFPWVAAPARSSARLAASHSSRVCGGGRAMPPEATEPECSSCWAERRGGMEGAAMFAASSVPG